MRPCNVNTRIDSYPQRNNYAGRVPEIAPSDMTINTSNTKFSAGIVNPLHRETVKTIVVFNSKFRDNFIEPTTDFTSSLNTELNNVVSLKLASLEFMNSYYTISDHLSTNNFKIKVYEYNLHDPHNIKQHATFKITINDGNYSINQLVDIINDIIQTTPPTINIVQTEPETPVTECIQKLERIEVAYFETLSKVLFRFKSPSDEDSVDAEYKWGFDLDFEPEQKCPQVSIFSNLGWLLGYRELHYAFLDKYIDTETNVLKVGYNPEAFANLLGSHFYLLQVNDFNRNESEVLRYNTSTAFPLALHDILGKVPNVATQQDVLFEDSSDRIFKSRRYFGPVRISKLRFTLYDEFGNIVDLNGADVTISIEIEQLNAPYKNIVC